jgi:peptide/nickel transport system substrate-binding protein
MSGVVPAMAKIEHYGQPRFDEAYMQVVLTPSAQRAAFEGCQVEMLPDMLTWTDIQALIAKNQIMYASPGYHYCYIGINVRDYVPDDYGQPDAGRSLAPLNWTAFRQALAWAGLNLAQKAAAIQMIYGGPAVTPVNNPVPPALGYWSNTALLDPGGDYAKAWEILQAAGFYKNTTDNKLYQPNGVPVRDQIEQLSPSAAPTSVAFTQKWVDQWNDFFDNYVGVTNCNYWNNPIPSATITQRVWLWRNFDQFFLCWGLGRFPDYLYDFFHSSQEGVDGNNAMGIKDPGLDALLEELKWGTVHEEKVDACWDAQELLVEELVPAVYLYSRTYYTAFKNYTYFDPTNPNYLVNMVNMKGQGADNGWTWGLMHWNGAPSGGMLKYCLTGDVEELHPGWASWAYEWDILNRVLDGLLAVNPYTVKDLPWIACDWKVEPFEWEPMNVVGQKVRFQIRDGTLWHDLEPVTVYDIQFALSFLPNFPRYGSIWQYVLWSQIVDPCTIDVYLNTTSQWIVYDLAGSALLFPKHIYGPDGWLETHGYDPVNAEVWNIPYNVGEARKALVGCGPYVFDSWDPATKVCHIVKFNHYWVDGPLKQNFIVPQRVDPDTPFNMSVEVVNTGSKDEATGELVPALIDHIDITLDGNYFFTIPGPITIAPFEHVILGPFEISLPKGPHYFDCHTYAYGELYDNYDSPIWITIKQDINLDFYVGVDDIFAAARAFGAQPPPFAGYERWDERCDMNDDYYIGIDDIFSIARNFGWDP